MKSLLYYYAHKDAINARKQEWERNNKPRRRDREFEREIRTLPPVMQELRRAMLAWRRWARENGVKLKELGD
jgi:hypothetical protein